MKDAEIPIKTNKPLHLESLLVDLQREIEAIKGVNEILPPPDPNRLLSISWIGNENLTKKEPSSPALVLKKLDQQTENRVGKPQYELKISLSLHSDCCAAKTCQELEKTAKKYWETHCHQYADLIKIEITVQLVETK